MCLKNRSARKAPTGVPIIGVISAMPVVVFAVVNIISPSYFGEVLGDPWFMPMMAVGVALLLLGQVIIWKMVNFRF